MRETFLVRWHDRKDDSLVSEWEVIGDDQKQSMLAIVNPPDKDFQVIPLSAEQVDKLAEIMGFPVDHALYEYALERQTLYKFRPVKE